MRLSALAALRRDWEQALSRKQGWAAELVPVNSSPDRNGNKMDGYVIFLWLFYLTHGRFLRIPTLRKVGIIWL